VYSEHTVSESLVVTQRLYMHRALKNVAVVEVDMERTADTTSEPLELLVELNRWTTSYDFTFLIHDSAREYVRCVLVNSQ